MFAISCVTRCSLCKGEEGRSKAAGISLFLIDLPQAAITYTPIPKHGFNYYKSNQVFIEDLRVHESCLLGEEGRGFYSLLGTLNPERVLIAAGAVGNTSPGTEAHHRKVTHREAEILLERAGPLRPQPIEGPVRAWIDSPVQAAGRTPWSARC